MNTKNTIIMTFLLTLILGCYKEPDFVNFDYETYNRVVGPKGGTIDFYNNYENDANNEITVSLDVPSGALDSMIVFNMYQFEDYELVAQMEKGYANIGSKFLYFVPFYESEGYYERGKLDLDYHLSIDFNIPVRVTYKYLADDDGVTESWQDTELYYEHYKSTNNTYKLYRIKIPKLDEWGDDANIFVNWTTQGYPDGYDRTDLYYIISGLWSPISEWGEGYVGLENWEPVPDFEIDNSNNKVSFDIKNTDYMYVLCRIIYIKAEDVPIKVKNNLKDLYPNLTITRASFSDDIFTLFLSDNSYAYFSKNGEFQYLTSDNISFSDLPAMAQDTITMNYGGDQVRKITKTENEWWTKYEVLLRSGKKLFFDDAGFLNGSFEFGVDPALLPDDAKAYLQNNHRNDLILNVTYDNEDFNQQYIVYLSSDAKVYFYGSGEWSETVYRVKENQLPESIISYFEENFPSGEFSRIHFTENYYGEMYYNIYLADNKWFEFNSDGILKSFEFPYLEESDLPDAINNFIQTHFANKGISEIYYYKYGDEYGGYDIYFDDQLNLEFDPDGNLLALYGNRLIHLPVPIRSFITTNFPNENVTYCSYNPNGFSFTLGPGDFVNNTWDIYFESDTWVGLADDASLIYTQKYDAVIADLPTPVMTYLNLNYQGLTNVVEYTYYNSSTYEQFIHFVNVDNVNILVLDEAGNLIGTLKSSGYKKTKKVLNENSVDQKRAKKAKMIEFIENMKNE